MKDNLVFPLGTKLPAKLTSAKLAMAIYDFRETNEDYGKADGANNNCFHAAAEFIGQLYESSQVAAVARSMYFCKSYDNGSSIGKHRFCGQPRNWRVHFTKDYPLLKWVSPGYVNHHVVRVGNLCIDFTARQFKARAPFPLLYLCDPVILGPAARKTGASHDQSSGENRRATGQARRQGRQERAVLCR